MSEKIRLDLALVERGLISSRERAKTTIMEGNVYVNEQKADKPGIQVSEKDAIEVRGKALNYVSRGGLKLEKALNYFEVDPKDAIVIDAGASTGGFTDCLLQRGAQKVYAVDVGYGQLAWNLRTHPQVVCMERTNVRYLTHETIPDELDLAVIDVSFISLSLVLPAIFNLLKENGKVLCLIKPQFEAGREKVGKKGVVRDPEVHREVLEHFCTSVKSLGFSVLGITYSPITGPEGNIEFLGHLQKNGAEDSIPDLEALVLEAHNGLKG